jgi:hypothetical protein
LSGGKRFTAKQSKSRCGRVGTVGRLVVKCLQRGHKGEAKPAGAAKRVKNIGQSPRLLKPSGLRLQNEVVKRSQKEEVKSREI